LKGTYKSQREDERAHGQKGKSTVTGTNGNAGGALCRSTGLQKRRADGESRTTTAWGNLNNYGLAGPNEARS